MQRQLAALGDEDTVVQDSQQSEVPGALLYIVSTAMHQVTKPNLIFQLFVRREVESIYRA